MLLNRRSLLLAGAGAAVGPSALTAQDLEARRRSIFQQVIPSPTGRNGYEELVAACDEIRKSRLYQATERQQADSGAISLAVKRRVMADPPVRRAFALVRKGLAKSVASPRESLSSSTLFPEMAPLRQIARAMAMRQYVQFAEGRVTDALAVFHDGLRLARAVQTDTLISGLVGVAIGAIVARTVGERLDQLDAPNCERLFRLCVEWHEQPDLLPRMVDVERRASRIFLAEIGAAGPKEIGSILGSSAGLDTPEAVEPSQLGDELLRARQSGVLGPVIEEAQRRLDRFYDHVAAEAAKPPWQRSWEDPPSGQDLPGRIAGLIGPAFRRIGDNYGRDGARLQLLAVHAAIRRYRWERDRLPENLLALNLGPLILDPFTGQPLRYEVLGRRYRLASAGPEADSLEDPKAVDGRLPVTVTPEP